MGYTRQYRNIGVDVNWRLYLLDRGTTQRERATKFWLTELVSKKVFLRHGYNCIYFIEPETLDMMQKIREFFNKPVRINDWWEGGYLNQRGYRSDFTTVGAATSQHRYRRAVDFDVKGMTADQVRNAIMSEQDLFYLMGVRRIEHGDYAPTWVHVDRLEAGLTGAIHVFKPRRTLMDIPKAETWTV